jgi:hypothetical protein
MFSMLHSFLLVFFSIGAIGLGSCKKPLLGSEGGRYSESELRAIKGIQVSTTGYETTFKIPFTYTWQKDKDVLFKRLTQSYVESMMDLKESFFQRNAEIKGIDKSKLVLEYHDEIRDVVENFARDVEKDKGVKKGTLETAEDQPPDIYMEISKQNLVQSYLIPQAVALFGAANFDPPVRLGLPVNQFKINVALVYVAQMFVTVTIDNHSKKEKLGPDGVPKRGYLIDGTMLFMPSLGAGAGVRTGGSLSLSGDSLGGGSLAAVGKAGQIFAKGCNAVGKLFPGQLGVGVLFGPLDSPHDLMGYGGLSFDVAGSLRTVGAFLRLVALGKWNKAPLYLGFLGADCSKEASAAMTITGTGFVDPATLAHWMGKGADPERIKSAQEIERLRKQAHENFTFPENTTGEFSF